MFGGKAKQLNVYILETLTAERDVTLYFYGKEGDEPDYIFVALRFYTMPENLAKRVFLESTFWDNLVIKCGLEPFE
jgi:hypothetical protein